MAEDPETKNSDVIIGQKKENSNEIPKSKEEIIELLKTDVKQFNLMREAYPSWEVDLFGKDLSIINLRGVDLRKADLEQTNLENVDLERANLERANLKGASLKGAKLFAANLREANLTEVNLEYTMSYDVNLEKANLEKANLKGAKLARANLKQANLREANLESTTLDGANLCGVNLEGANLQYVKLSEANLAYVNLTEKDLRGASLGGTNLEGKDLGEAILESADLEFANLEGANLRNTKFNNQTKLASSKVKNAKIYKFNLEQLKDYGGLTLSQLREMKIIYDLGTLRQAFSGWMSFIHIVALILFVLPYIFYLGSQIAISKVIDSSITQSIDAKSKVENDLNVGKEKLNDVLEKELEQVPLVREQKEKILSIVKRKIDDQNKNIVNNLSIRKPNETTIGWALVSYIWNNDFKIFCFLLGYNLLRILLLWKTKSLEHVEAIQGLCSNFTFTGKAQSLEEEGYIKKIVKKVINPIRSTFEIPFQYFLEIIIKLVQFMKSNVENWLKGGFGGWVVSCLELVIDFVADIKTNSKWYRFYIFMEIGFIFNVLLVGCHVIYFFRERIHFY